MWKPDLVVAVAGNTSGHVRASSSQHVAILIRTEFLNELMQPLWLHFCLSGAISPMYSRRKEGRVQICYFRFNRQRGPVNALQMRLQG